MNTKHQTISDTARREETNHEPNLGKPSDNLNKVSTRHFRPALFIAIAMATLAVTWPRWAEGQITNGVFAPGSSPYGKTYAQWSAAWWQWNFSLPTTHSPVQDTAPLETGQSGPVWFLAGTFGSSGFVSRGGAVPEGTALFIPIAESWADNAGCPPTSYSVQQLRDMAASFQDQSYNLSCTIDGVAVAGLSDPIHTLYRVQSPVFDYTMPGLDNFAYNIFGATCYLNFAGTPFVITGAVADGVYLIVSPLGIGQHTIHFAAWYPYSYPPYFTIQDITYTLTIVPTPALKMAVQGSNLVLSWPQPASWYSLETTTSLGSTNWVDAGAQVQQADGQFQASVPVGIGSQFFRLKRN